jgi:hypothetical protein
LHDIEHFGLDLVSTVLLNEGIKIFLSPTGDDNSRSILDKFGGQCLADARGGTDDQDLLVLERHFSRIALVAKLK